MDTIQPYSATGRLETTAFSGMKPAPTTVPFADRLPPYTPMSTTTSGFVGPDPTSGLPYPFYNFDAMHAAASLAGGGSAAPLPEVDFRAMTSSNGYSMSSGGDVSGAVGGLQRYAGDCRPPGAMPTGGPGFLSADRTPYVNGGITALAVNSSTGQQMSPPSAITPTSPTAIVYPWMTIVGRYMLKHFFPVFRTFFRY